MEHDAKPVVAEVGRALRTARKRRGLSQRDFAQQIGVSKSRVGRLESDAGPQSLEMVSQVLMASGFRLEVIDTSGAKAQQGDASAAALLDLCDVSGRRFRLTSTHAALPAHRPTGSSVTAVGSRLETSRAGPTNADTCPEPRPDVGAGRRQDRGSCVQSWSGEFVVSSMARSSAIWAVLSAAPLRRLSPQTNRSMVLGKSSA